MLLWTMPLASNTDTGVVVTRVVPRSAASRLGLEPGDRIVTVGGFQVGWAPIRCRIVSVSSELCSRTRRGVPKMLNLFLGDPMPGAFQSIV